MPPWRIPVDPQGEAEDDVVYQAYRDAMFEQFEVNPTQNNPWNNYPGIPWRPQLLPN